MKIFLREANRKDLGLTISQVVLFYNTGAPGTTYKKVRSVSRLKVTYEIIMLKRNDYLLKVTERTHITMVNNMSTCVICFVHQGM